MVSFFDAKEGSIESSIKIVDDDDSIKPVSNLVQLHY